MLKSLILASLIVAPLFAHAGLDPKDDPAMVRSGKKAQGNGAVVKEGFKCEICNAYALGDEYRSTDAGYYNTPLITPDGTGTLPAQKGPRTGVKKSK